MAFQQTPDQRLDSWKAISSYLGRDERTVRRWEKDLGLPVRRVQGRRGHSVFAYVAEVEAWLQSHRAGLATDSEPVNPPAIVPVTSTASAGRRASRLGIWLAGAAVVLSLVAWRALAGGSSNVPQRLRISETGVTAVDGSNRELWQYRFPAGEQVSAPTNGEGFVPADRSSVLAVTTGRVRLSDGVPLGGQILRFTPDGRPDGEVTLDDELRFGATTYSGPWAINDARFDEHDGRARIAVVAHHMTWWPGIVAVFDSQLHRTARFVNSGWVEVVKWAAADRLLVSGFSNARDGGMVVLLDPNVPDAQSPEAPGSQFACAACGAGRPLRYIVFPRSELNRLTGSGFNRARMDMLANRVVIHTDEVVQSYAYIADAVYEFTPSLDLVHATYSDRYWDVHDALEAQGKITHSREQCPDRNGPQALLVWEPVTGWRTQPIVR